MTAVLLRALTRALYSALALFLSHAVCVSIILYMDLSGRWEQYALHKNRSTGEARVADYVNGWKKFAQDIAFLFLPCITICFYYMDEAITLSKDTIPESFVKLGLGYVMGKIWAFAIHYILHFPQFYHIHKRHHRNPKNLVASAAWDDSFLEYFVMEIPSFAMALVFFPTLWHTHILHFLIHGWDGACGHSGFKAPGLLGAMFDGEYHYHHHNRLTVNYAELEFLDKWFGTHHTQKLK